MRNLGNACYLLQPMERKRRWLTLRRTLLFLVVFGTAFLFVPLLLGILGARAQIIDVHGYMVVGEVHPLPVRWNICHSQTFAKRILSHARAHGGSPESITEKVREYNKITHPMTGTVVCGTFLGYVEVVEIIDRVECVSGKGVRIVYTLVKIEVSMVPGVPIREAWSWTNAKVMTPEEHLWYIATGSVGRNA